MKSLIISLALILSVQLSYAQSELAYHVGNEVISTETKYTGLDKNIDHPVEQSRLAMQTLRKHLIANIEYPEIMMQYGFEGSVVVEVKISDSGMIEKTKIVKSISPLFDKAIIDAMESLDYALAQGQKYQGKKIMQLPISFSIR